MSSNSSSSISASTGTPGLLGVLFVGLKLTGHIDWPWLWVLSPFWIPLAVVIGFLLVGALLIAVASILEK